MWKIKITAPTPDHGQIGGVGADDHHDAAHTVSSHSDTGVTGGELTDFIGEVTQLGATAAAFAIITLFR